MEIIGHSSIVDYFKKVLESGSLVHAYLFVGPKHVGKTTVARWIVEELFETDSTLWSRPDADIHWISRGQDKKEIAIEQIKNLRVAMQQTPFVHTHKVAIIEQASSLSNAAANSLLKVLEEPPGKSLFILLATSLDTIPQTIVSRCQVISFKRVSQDIITQSLSDKTSNILELANMASGLPGKAISWIDNTSDYESMLAEVTDHIGILDKEITKKFAFVDNLLPAKGGIIEQSQIAQRALSVWLSLFHDILLIKAGLSDSITNVHVKDKIENLVKKLNYKEISYWFRLLNQTEKQLRANVNPRLVLENFLLQISYE